MSQNLIKYIPIPGSTTWFMDYYNNGTMLLFTIIRCVSKQYPKVSKHPIKKALIKMLLSETFPPYFNKHWTSRGISW